MSRLSPQRRKIVVLAAMIPCWTMPAMLVTHELHDSWWLPAFVIAYVLGMAAMLVYVMVQLATLKRRSR